jgi:hypothetical protein
MLPSVVGGAIVVTGALTAGAAPAVCPPAAVVEGTPAVARSISGILSRHGIRSGPNACAGPFVRAYVSDLSSRTGYLLRIEDRFGRANDREVPNVETAASLIESWVLDEDADLVAPRAAPAAIAAAPTSRVPAVADASVRLHALGEVAASDDDATWFGGSASACARFRSVCIGGRARFARTSATWAAEQLSIIASGDLTRTAWGALATIEVPVQRGHFLVAPRFGLGADWTHAVGTLEPVFASMSADTFSLRAEGAVAAAVTIGRGWSVVGELGAHLGSPIRRTTRQGPEMLLPGAATAAIVAGFGIGYSQ